MAGVGNISRIFTSLAAGLAQQLKSAATTQQVAPASGSGGSQGGGAQHQTSSRPRQLINIDGQIFDRHARRGTYVDILV